MKSLETAMMAFCKANEWEKAFQCVELEWKESKNYRLVATFRDLVRSSVTEKTLKLYRASYDLTARDVFDDFMLALEWNRPAEEQFWLPRRDKLKGVCEALQSLEEGKLDELFLSLPPRVGKALANDTPILTRNGWKNHGDLEVGDEVIGMDGKFKKVIAVHPKCDLDRLVEFTNGERVQCHENHEWLFYDRHSHTQKLLETKEWEQMELESGEEGKRGHRYHLQLPFKEFVEGEEKELPLDPYTLGVWLGDGSNQNPRITGDANDYAVIQRIIDNGYPVKWSTVNKATGVPCYEFDFRPQLRSMGMCHSKKRTEKHIPQEYLTASIRQRLELLAGLIDTDGCLIKKEHRYQFTTCDEELRDTFLELIATFGWRTNVTVHEPRVSSSGVVGRKPTYIIGFNPTCYIPCVLERKQLHEYSKQRKVAVKSITKVEPKQGNCITVEGGMYLCGKSMIPTHNTTLILFFLLWVMLRDSERSNLYSSYTESVVNTFYGGLIEILDDPYTYRWKEIFPGSCVASTNAKDNLLNLDRKKRYASLTARSLYGTLNGACDCNGYLIGDDLHSGIEEALNKALLDKAWGRVTNNLIPRAKEGAKLLWIGTRWSLYDCIARRIELLQHDPSFERRRFKVFNLPALDEDEHSNFEYLYGVGFSADHYKRIRATFERSDDIASFLAQYMGEPVERAGTLFDPSVMRYFNGVLPTDVEPDKIFMTVDPAWGGGDYVAAPCIVQYGFDLYVVDVVYNNGDKKITQPKIVQMAIKNNVGIMYIEGTRVTSSYAEGVSDLLNSKGYKLNLQTTTKHWGGGGGKAQRIYNVAPDIKERMIFLTEKKRSKEYQQFMMNVFAFTIEGKVKHDDAPDSLAMAVQMDNSFVKAEIYKRPF